MSHYVSSEDSDYFIGWCECTQLPCLSCVAVQARLERVEALRGAVVQAYFDHHGHWPKSTFIDSVMHSVGNHPIQPEEVTI